MKLTKDQYYILTKWIRDNLIPIKSINYRDSTGTIRVCFEKSENGFYIDNQTLNDILIECGFTPSSTKDPYYWYFNISKKSPGITQYFDNN